MSVTTFTVQKQLDPQLLTAKVMEIVHDTGTGTELGMRGAGITITSNVARWEVLLAVCRPA